MYLKESDDCDLIVGDQRLGSSYFNQGDDSGACALLQPVDDVICLSASFNTTKITATHELITQTPKV